MFNFKKTVHELNKVIFSPEFTNKHRRKEEDFTRNRSLTLPNLISFMLNMVNGSVQSELSRFFQVNEDSHVTKNSVTTSAFSKARKKFYHTAFKDLNTCLADTFYDNSYVQLWNGFRLLAVDGSVTNLPERTDLADYFGRARSHSIRPSARLFHIQKAKEVLL